jgi:hypothetical protein
LDSLRLGKVGRLVLLAELFGLAGVCLSPAWGAEGCIAQVHRYPEGARIEAHLVTGIKTRTAVPVYVVCRGGIWVWPGTGKPVAGR